jgi:hypothetical protein
MEENGQRSGAPDKTKGQRIDEYQRLEKGKLNGVTRGKREKKVC